MQVEGEVTGRMEAALHVQLQRGTPVHISPKFRRHFLRKCGRSYLGGKVGTWLLLPLPTQRTIGDELSPVVCARKRQAFLLLSLPKCAGAFMDVRRVSSVIICALGV